MRDGFPLSALAIRSEGRMNTKTLTLTLHEGYFVRRTWFDWFFALATLAGGG